MAQLWLNSKKISISFFLTGSTTKPTYMGIPVISPLELQNRDKYTVLVSVTTTNSQTYRNSTNLLFGDDLIGYLKSIGFHEVYSLKESSEKFFPDCLKQKDANIYMWTSDSNYKTAYQYDLENPIKIKLLQDNIFDSKSKNLYSQIIKFRETLNYSHYPIPETNGKQYLEPDFINKIDKITMLDLGAFNGDTAEDFINILGERISSIYCVEPSAENQIILKDFIESNQLFTEKIIPIMCAMGSKSGLTQISGSGSDLKINKLQNDSNFATNSTTIPICTIDETFSDLGINLIKMDIEGAELDVILGANNYIKNFSPFLAIAIYHKPTDLFDIPNEILRINPNYYFMLRLYSENVRELVLYCIPKTYK